MDEPDIEARRGAWTRYWRSGALHSCAGSWDGNYGGAIAAFWKTRFAAMSPTDRVLDIGTGNGPVLALLVDAIGSAGLPELDAVDLASPSPAWIDGQPSSIRDRMRFRGGVDMAALPFPDGTFDHVVSQFGFEYGERDRALAEIGRVAGAGARVALVCHCAGSRLVEVAIEDIAHIEWALSSGGVLDGAAAMLPHVALSGTPDGAERLRADVAANRTRAAFNESMAELQSRADAAAVPDALLDCADGLMALFRETAARGVDAGRAALSQWRQALADSMLRSRELIAHALDDAAVAEVERELHAAGWVEVECAMLREAGHVVAWAITASERRPG